MPRPPRCRRICSTPKVDTFCPNGSRDAEPILLTLDEYEVIRLVDLEQQTHEQCAAQMDISRSTVQEIYESSRRKLAACLVYGKPLHITGGSYRICGGQEHSRCGQCRRTYEDRKHNTDHEGENSMKIAVTYGMDKFSSTLVTPRSLSSMRSRKARLSVQRSWIPTAVGTAYWRAF